MAHIKVSEYDSFFGGKSGSGTYQVLANHTPPHTVRFVGFTGKCGLTCNIRPAELNILNDLDDRVIGAWREALGDNAPGYVLLCCDAIDLLTGLIADQYDKPDTFIYLDPPYRFATRKGQRPVYRFEMSDEQHRQLLTAIKALRHARVMISHYPNDMYDEALAGWYTFDYYSTIRGGVALERIYCNYTPGDELHDYSYIGEDFREREKLSRIKKNYLKKLRRLDPRLRNAILQDLASQISAVLQPSMASIENLCDVTRCVDHIAEMRDTVRIEEKREGIQGDKNCDAVLLPECIIAQNSGVISQ